MDEALAALATTGAQTIVTLMATDVWQKTKDLVTRIFANEKTEKAAAIGHALDNSRDQVLAIGSSSNPDIRERVIDQWEAQLRLRLLDDAGAADLIRQLIEVANDSHSVRAAPKAREISMRAEAKDNARIYQQGQGIQYNE